MKPCCAIGTLLLATALAVGCSSITVNYDYDTGADLTALKTYAWLPRPDVVSQSVRDELTRNSLVDRRVRDAVNRELAAKRIEEVSRKEAQFEVTYHIGVEDKVDVRDWGYSYGGYYRHGVWGGRDISVYPYREGTLILDFIDPKTHNLIWRGIAQAVLSKNEDPTEQDKVIGKAVKKILEGFPPKPAE